MNNADYAAAYRDIDFRKQPERYRIGRGEQGVLIAEPYKSEILPHWKFATPELAERSAGEIYRLFVQYGNEADFVGMDMARKFLQMGFTRARRYANHASGRKYTSNGTVRPQDTESEQSDKARSADIFRRTLLKARADKQYQELKTAHQRAVSHRTGL